MIDLQDQDQNTGNPRPPFLPGIGSDNSENDAGEGASTPAPDYPTIDIGNDNDDAPDRDVNIGN